MKFRKLLSLILVLVLSFSTTFAIEDTKTATQSALSLEECIEYALKHNHNIQLFRDRVKLAKTQVGLAKSNYFPTLGLDTGYYFQTNAKNNHLGTETSSFYSAEASINQLIYDFGKTGAKINAQKFHKIAAEYYLDDCILSTIFLIRKSYFAVLAARANIEVEKSNVDINTHQYKRTKAFFEEGLRSKIDLVNAEVNLSDAKIKLIQAQNNYNQAIINLEDELDLDEPTQIQIKNPDAFNLTTNVSTKSLFNVQNKQDSNELPAFKKGEYYNTKTTQLNLVKSYTLKKFPYTMQQAIEYAEKNRPDLRALDATLKAMEESLKYAKREYMPSLLAGAGYNYKNSNVYINNGFNAGANLSFPLINGMYIKNRIDEAKACLDIAQDTIELETHGVYFNVQRKYTNMIQLEKQIPLAEVKVRQTFENLQLADGRYEVGLGDFIEYQNAIINYNTAQQKYIKTIFDYNVARAELELVMAVKPDDIKKLED